MEIRRANIKRNRKKKLFVIINCFEASVTLVNAVLIIELNL